jgi:hypothetical protein
MPEAFYECSVAAPFEVCEAAMREKVFHPGKFAKNA